MCHSKDTFNPLPTIVHQGHRGKELFSDVTFDFPKRLDSGLPYVIVLDICRNPFMAYKILDVFVFPVFERVVPKSWQNVIFGRLGIVRSTITCITFQSASKVPHPKQLCSPPPTQSVEHTLPEIMAKKGK